MGGNYDKKIIYLPQVSNLYSRGNLSWGHKGSVLFCSMLLVTKYCWRLYDVKGGPLCDIILFSVPHELKNHSRAKITLLAEIRLMNSTSVYFVRWSIITKIYWPLGNGPKKSRLTVSNVSEGVGWDNNLSRSCDGVTDYQETS